MAGERALNSGSTITSTTASKVLVRLALVKGSYAPHDEVFPALRDAARQVSSKVSGDVIMAALKSSNDFLFGVSGPEDLQEALAESAIAADSAMLARRLPFEVVAARMSPGTYNTSAENTWANLGYARNADVTDMALTAVQWSRMQLLDSREAASQIYAIAPIEGKAPTPQQVAALYPR
jgi:hypothetical protein